MLKTCHFGTCTLDQPGFVWDFKTQTRVLLLGIANALKCQGKAKGKAKAKVKSAVVSEEVNNCVGALKLGKFKKKHLIRSLHICYPHDSKAATKAAAKGSTVSFSSATSLKAGVRVLAGRQKKHLNISKQDKEYDSKKM